MSDENSEAEQQGYAKPRRACDEIIDSRYARERDVRVCCKEDLAIRDKGKRDQENDRPRINRPALD